MAGGVNLATKYVDYIDEQFDRESIVGIALSTRGEFKGDKTFKIYSFPVVPLVDYTRSGLQRYGVPDDVNRHVQTVQVTQDKAFTYIVDAGDKTQTQNLTDAGKQLTRQNKLSVIPYYDTYCLRKLFNAAANNDALDLTAATKTNAYELFLKGMERMGDHNVPDQGRVAFCSYRFANLLKQDPAFMRYGNLSQEMINKGIMGEVDGCKIVKVPSSRLPSGCAFIIVHPLAACAPKQLDEYKIHDNPPGISGWLVEGRLIFDCFVFSQKVDAIYACGGQATLKTIPITVGSIDENNHAMIYVNEEKEKDTNKFYVITAADHASLPAVTYNTAIDPTSGPWAGAIEITAGSIQLTVPDGHTAVRVVEVLRNMKPVGYGDANLD